eukprot:11157925-Lingulodinium_polyedra.AAC.1
MSSGPKLVEREPSRGRVRFLTGSPSSKAHDCSWYGNCERRARVFLEVEDGLARESMVLDQLVNLPTRIVA